MSYDDLYPNAEEFDIVAGSMLKSDEERKCISCHMPTHWLDLDKEMYICSENCSYEVEEIQEDERYSWYDLWEEYYD